MTSQSASIQSRRPAATRAQRACCGPNIIGIVVVGGGGVVGIVSACRALLRNFISTQRSMHMHTLAMHMHFQAYIHTSTRSRGAEASVLAYLMVVGGVFVCVCIQVSVYVCLCVCVFVYIRVCPECSVRACSSLSHAPE